MEFWDLLMAHRHGWVRFLSIVAMIATGVYLSVFGDWDWYLWVPASALVYLVLPVLWGLKKKSGAAMGWFNGVDIGVRPRNVLKGTDVNLYPFTRRGVEWLEQNLDQFSQPVWSQRERCLMLSESDASHIGLALTVGKLQRAGLKLRFYGRLKGWDGLSPWVG
jgi:hypothetical protein